MITPMSTSYLLAQLREADSMPYIIFCQFPCFLVLRSIAVLSTFGEDIYKDRINIKTT